MKVRKEIKIGIYAVVIMLGAWAGIRFLSGVDVFGRHATYYVHYNEVNGLQSAAAVMLRGVKIGKVTDITVSPEDPSVVEVAFTVPRSYKLPIDSKAQLFSPSLMGGKAINIVMGESEEILKNGESIEADFANSLLEDVGNSFGDIKAQLGEVMDKLNSTLQGLNSLVDNNSQPITEAIAHLNSITSGLDNVVGNDSAKLAEIVESINSFAKTLKNNSGRIDSVVANVDGLVSDLKANEAGKRLSESIAELNKVLEKINKGDGSVGKLVGDDKLYANLTEASANLSALLADLKENPKRYIHLSLIGGKDATEKEKEKEAKKAARAAKRANK